MLRSIVTVLQPADSPDLVTLDSVKLELSVIDNSQDDQLAAWITQASEVANNYCQTTLRARTVSETFRHEVGFNGDGCQARFYHGFHRREVREMLVFGSAPVSSVASVTVDGALVPSDQWENDDDRIFRLNTSGYPMAWYFSKSVVINYTAGFDLANVPADLQRAILLIIREIRGAASREDPMLKVRETVGVSRLEWWVPAKPTSTLPSDISGILDNYSRQWTWMT